MGWIAVIVIYLYTAMYNWNKHHCYKTIILQQLKIRNIWINKFIVLNVCTRWCCQVILIVDDVISSSKIAPNSLNNNNTVYAFDPLIVPFLSHTGSRNAKNRLWLTLFCEVFGHLHATQVTILSRADHYLPLLRLANNVSDPPPPRRARKLPKWGRKTFAWVKWFIISHWN